MPQLLTESLKNIYPGEDGLSESHLARVISFTEEYGSCLPVPARWLGQGYIHLDGRHRLIYDCLRGCSESNLFVAFNSWDLMHNAAFPGVETDILRAHNHNITQRWTCAESIFYQLPANNYLEHFENLQSRYDFLKDLKTCKEYLESRNQIF